MAQRQVRRTGLSACRCRCVHRVEAKSVLHVRRQARERGWNRAARLLWCSMLTACVHHSDVLVLLLLWGARALYAPIGEARSSSGANIKLATADSFAATSSANGARTLFPDVMRQRSAA